MKFDTCWKQNLNLKLAKKNRLNRKKKFFELILLLFVKYVYSQSINKRLLNWNIIRVQKNIWTIKIIIDPMLPS